MVQATGGMTGNYINAYLDEVHIDHRTSNLDLIKFQYKEQLELVPHYWIRFKIYLTQNTGDMTELIEPAGRVELGEKSLIEQKVSEIILSAKNLEAIALCGTLPPGLTASTYSFISGLKPNGTILLLDAFQNAKDWYWKIYIV